MFDERDDINDEGNNRNRNDRGDDNA